MVLEDLALPLDVASTATDHAVKTDVDNGLRNDGPCPSCIDDGIGTILSGIAYR